MQDGYAVSHAVLADQARQVQNALDELRSAFDTASSVALTDNAFGPVPADAVPAIGRLGDAGIDTLVAGMNALAATTSNLRATAVAYEQQEADGVATFGGVSGELTT